MQGWEGTPKFVEGQPLSANAHLNYLLRAETRLAEEWLNGGIAMRCIAYPDSNNPYSAWLRYAGGHQLCFLLEMDNDGPAPVINIIINTNIGPYTLYTAHYGVNGTWLVELNITDTVRPLLTEGNTYEITMSGTGRGRLWYIREQESYPGIVLPTLASFADGTTPTAVEWQATSDYAEDLATLMTHSHAVQTGSLKHGFQNTNFVTIWQGMMHHRARTLRCIVKVTCPFNDADVNDPNFNPRWANADIYINEIGDNDRPAVRLRACDWRDIIVAPFPPDTAPIWYQQLAPQADLTKTFDIEIDLDTVPSPPAYGADYKIRVRGQSSTDWDDFHGVQVYLIQERPGGAAPVVAGWTTIAPWTYPDIVQSYGPHNISALKDNLEVLGGVVQRLNYPFVFLAPYQDVHPVAYMRIRQDKWLHYKTREGQEPKLIYSYDEDGVATSIEIGLDDAHLEIKTYNLEQAKGLYVGVAYEVQNVLWAVESEDA